MKTKKTTKRAPILDVTRDDARVFITGRRETKEFVIRTLGPGEWKPGARVVARVHTDGWETGFAWATPAGLDLWRKYWRADGRPTKWTKYSDMLERPSHYIALGCKYDVRPV